MERCSDKEIVKHVKEGLAHVVRRLASRSYRNQNYPLEWWEKEVEEDILNYGYTPNFPTVRMAIIDENDNIIYRAGDSVKSENYIIYGGAYGGGLTGFITEDYLKGAKDEAV